MFLQVSVCTQEGVSAPLHAGIHPPPPPLGPEADTPYADTPRAVDAGIRSISGRYVSHWNAFLLNS